MADDWNFIVGRITGDGNVDIVDTELPIEIGSIDQTLSSPSGMSGTITNSVRRLRNQGRPVFDPNNTVILAEASDQLRGMGLYRRPKFDGDVWELEIIGLPGYALGKPYDNIQDFVQTDSLDIYRHIWAHLQSFPRGNLGITIDPLKSGVLLGTNVIEGDSESGPYKLNWWDTRDLGKTIDDLAKATPFDWVEEVSWVGDQPRCHIALGSPQIGVRNERLTGLVLGANMATIPTITGGEEFNEVHLLGAGEGRARVRGYAAINDGKVRNVKTIDDKGIAETALANLRAREELQRSRGAFAVDRVEVYDHSFAPLSELSLGMELPFFADTPHVEVDTWVRIVGISTDPNTGDRATLTVVTVETS